MPLFRHTCLRSYTSVHTCMHVHVHALSGRYLHISRYTCNHIDICLCINIKHAHSCMGVVLSQWLQECHLPSSPLQTLNPKPLDSNHGLKHGLRRTPVIQEAAKIEGPCQGLNSKTLRNFLNCSEGMQTPTSLKPANQEYC